jgi:hypothetical protein
MNALLTAATNKLIYGTLFLFIFSTAQAQTAGATRVQKQDSATASFPAGTASFPGATVSFQGTKDDMVLFNVAFQNPSGDKFCLLIKDQDGNQLYQHVFKDKNFHQQFRLPGADKSQVAFIFRNYKQADITKTFQINVNSHLVEDVAVRKL